MSEKIGSRVITGLCMFLGFLIWPPASNVGAVPSMQLQAARNFVTARNPSQVIPVNLDWDTDLDAVVLHTDPLFGSNIQLFENPGDGTLVPFASVPVPTGNSLAVADLNNDNHRDFVQVHANDLASSELVIVTWEAPFSFSVMTQPLPFVANRLCAGNLDGLLGPDLVIPDDILPHTVHVYLHNNLGGYDFHGTYDTELIHRDANGDGFIDTQCDFSAIDCICDDLDNDGIDDLILTNSMKRYPDYENPPDQCYSSNRVNNVVTLINPGNGSLGPFQVVLDIFGRELGTGDMDNDGDKDIVTIGTSISGPDRDDVILIANNGNGTFQPEVRFASGGGVDSVKGISLGDVDGDLDLDVGVMHDGPIIGNMNDALTGHWSLLRNGGGGNLARAEIYPAGAEILDLAFADLDNDGGLEALSIANDDNRLSVYYNQGGFYPGPVILSITNPQATVNGSTPIDIASSDLNGDGLADLAIIVNHSLLVGDGPDTLTILLGVDNGISPVFQVVDLPSENPIRLLSVPIFGNITADPAVAFLGSSYYGYPMGVGLSAGLVGGLPSPMQFLSLNGGPADLATFDILDNTITDLVVLRIREEGLTAGISVIEVGADGSLSWLGDIILGSDDVMDFDCRLPYVLAGGDMNNDGISDLIAASWNTLGTKEAIITVILYNGNLNFSLAGEFLSVSREVSDIIIKDVTGNGFNDVILTTVASHDSSDPDGSLEVLPNLGGGVLGQATSYNVGTGPVRVVAADMDRSPGLDLVVACDGSNEVSLLLNDGSGGFPVREQYLSGGGTDALAVADLDQDGDNDVAVCNDDHSTNGHEGTVSLLTNINVVSLPGDIDGDGDVDGFDLALYVDQLVQGTNIISLPFFVTYFGR